MILPFLLLAQALPTPPPVTPAPSPTPTLAPPPILEPPLPKPAAPPLPHPIRLALASTSAFGVTNNEFFNQLLGARLDYRATSRFAFGGALSYANLEGKQGRAHNVLPELLLEYRIPIAGERVGVPLRFMPGYLAKNGPTLRVGAGLDFGLSERVSLEVVPLEPMLWVSRERPEVSFNGSLALRFAF